MSLCEKWGRDELLGWGDRTEDSPHDVFLVWSRISKDIETTDRVTDLVVTTSHNQLTYSSTQSEISVQSFSLKGN